MSFYIWKGLRWAAVAAMVMFVVKNPDRAAHLVMQIVDGVSKVLMGFIGFLSTLVTHLTGA